MLHGGHCINAAIDKYVYVLVKKRSDNKIYLKYSENEVVDVDSINAINSKYVKSNKPNLNGKSNNILLSTDFTLKNFKSIFLNNNFFELLMTTFYFTFFGTLGAILLGIFAAQLVNQKFYGRTFMRIILLFHYV